MKMLACAAVGSALSIGCASAADLPAKTPIYKAPAVTAPGWTGFYIGANVGGGWGRRDVDFTPKDPATVLLFDPASGGAPPATSFDVSGVLGGLQLGYNWQFEPNWLLGIEADFDWSGIKGSGAGATTVASRLPSPVTASVDEHIKWFGTVRARLGYLPANNLLAYVTGGFAYGKVEHSGTYVNSGVFFGANTGGFSFLCNAGTCFAGSSNNVATGWTVGGGLEYAILKNLTLKAEYLYVSLDTQSVAETALAFTPGTTPASFSANFSRTTFNVARVGVNYRF